MVSPRAGRLLLLAAFVLACVAPVRAFKRTHVGEVAGEFSLESLAGESLSLSRQLGAKATLLVFWATWSPRSGEVLEEFQELYEEYREQGLGVFAVNVEHQEWRPEERGKIAGFLESRGIAFPVVLDKDLAVFDRYGVIAVPSTALLDAEGRVLELLEGYSNMTRPGFRERVLRQLGVSDEPVAVEAADRSYQPKGKAARYLQMGEIFLRKKMGLRAIKAFRTALREDPQYAEAYTHLAEAYELEEQPDKAAAAREKARALTPGRTGKSDKSDKAARTEGTQASGGSDKHAPPDLAEQEEKP